MAHEKETQMIDLIQYVTNMVYYARHNHKITDKEFEEWLDQHTEGIKGYFLSTLPEEKEEKSNPICPKLKACISESGIQCPKYDVICPI